MGLIAIDINESDNIYILTGDISKLVDSPRKKLYLSDFLNAIIKDQEIQIPFPNEDKETILIKIQELLKSNNLIESRSAKVENLFQKFFDENLKFDDFSEQANSIRNNILTQTQKFEFKSFTQELLRILPNRRLYELQLLSAYHLAFSQNACNFSVPGAGKTSIVYGAYAYLKNLPLSNYKHVSNLVIIGPLSSFGPWESEYKECFGVAPSLIRMSGGINEKVRTRQLYGNKPQEIMLFSYNSIPSIQQDLINFLKVHPTMVVLDEAHKIKNIDGGVWANSALEISRFCGARVILTGTPVPNGYEDLFNLYKFIWPTKEIIKFYPYQLKEMTERNNDARIKTLISEVSPYFIRIRKSDLDLPVPIENDPIFVQMGVIQKEIYKAIESKFMNQIGQNINSKSFIAQNQLKRARLIRLMQASINPSLLLKPLEKYYLESGWVDDFFIEDGSILRKIIDYSKLETPPKFKAAMDLINKLIAKGEKVLVWTIFIQNIIEFNEFLKLNGVKSEIIFGATPVDSIDNIGDELTRESIIKEFHKPNGRFNVLIANPFAIAESISLHKACHNAIYLDRNFNAGNFIQSKDRIHRYGLKKDDKINYFYLLSDNNIDRTIHSRLIEKERRMLQIIESEPIPLFKLLDSENVDYEDMRALIKNYVSSK